MLEWKIWFWDGKDFITKTNLDTEVRDCGNGSGFVEFVLPILPVAVIVNVRHDHNGSRRWIESGRNYYCYMPNGEWWASTLSGLLNYIDFHRGNAAVLRGGMLDSDIYQKVYDMAKNDEETISASQFYKERDVKESFD